MEKLSETHEKTTVQTTDVELPNNEAQDLPQEKKGTQDDVRDMYRMGKMQQMKRNFRFVGAPSPPNPTQFNSVMC